MNMQYITNFSNSISKPFENKIENKMIKKALHTSTVPLENVCPYYNILNSACQVDILVNNDFLVMEDYTCTSYE